MKVVIWLLWATAPLFLYTAIAISFTVILITGPLCGSYVQMCDQSDSCLSDGFPPGGERYKEYECVSQMQWGNNKFGSFPAILTEEAPKLLPYKREQRQKHNCTYPELLQSLSVLQWILTFLLLGPACALLISWVIYSQLWPLFTIYIIWMISDRKTPDRGGRRSLWMSKWTMWKHFRDYFPIKLHKTAELDPKHNYIFAYHPHGIMSIGAFCNFGTDSTGFSHIFPNLKPHLTTLAGNFKVPLYRDYLLAAGMCSVTHSSIDYLLSSQRSGNAVIIVIGGAAEALNCTRNKHILTLKKRKGFIRKALANGAFLVPVYSFGENEVLEQYHFEAGSWKRTLQETFQQWIGFAPCIFFGQGFFSSASKGIMPLRKAINTVVGKPIPVPKVETPSEQQVDTYHALYIKSLQELFNAHKEQFGLQQSDPLVVV